MPGRTLDSSRRWVDEGTVLFLESLRRIDDSALSGPTMLPGWTGRHLVAHVAANADALGNLVRWAATGDESPMYSSPDERAAGIESGAKQSPTELRSRVAKSADELATAMDGLSSDQWSRQIRTAQGRTVPAAEIPWLRAREVLIHALDLDPARRFAELPEDFLTALVDDVVAKRSAADQQPLNIMSSDGATWTIDGAGAPAHVYGSLAAIAAYLTGRGEPEVVSAVGEGVPELSPWL